MATQFEKWSKLYKPYTDWILKKFRSCDQSCKNFWAFEKLPKKVKINSPNLQKKPFNLEEKTTFDQLKFDQTIISKFWQ
jgi:hypothetical protein